MQVIHTKVSHARRTGLSCHVPVAAQGVVKLKVDVLDDDDDGYDFVDHYEYQYTTRQLTRELDAPVKALKLSGSRSR